MGKMGDRDRIGNSSEINAVYEVVPTDRFNKDMKFYIKKKSIQNYLKTLKK